MQWCSLRLWLCTFRCGCVWMINDVILCPVIMIMTNDEWYDNDKWWYLVSSVTEMWTPRCRVSGVRWQLRSSVSSSPSTSLKFTRYLIKYLCFSISIYFYLYFQGLMHSSNDDELREVKQFIEKRLKWSVAETRLFILYTKALLYQRLSWPTLVVLGSQRSLELEPFLANLIQRNNSLEFRREYLLVK